MPGPCMGGSFLFCRLSGGVPCGGGSVGYYTEDNLPDNSYTISEDDPYAALAQAAADAAAAAGDTTTEPTE